MSQRTALVVDDSKSARFALRKYLERHDYVVDTAESAATAYQQLRDKRPDLIFLDHMMPGEDGFEALRQIKADPHTASIPVVICSGNDDPDFAVDACSQGAAGVLNKPPTPAQLLQMLEQVTRPTLAAVTVAPVAESADDATGDAAIQDDPSPAAAPSAAARPDTHTAPVAAPAEMAVLLSRLERLEQELAATRRQLAEDREQISREVCSRVAEALLAGLGRRS